MIFLETNKTSPTGKCDSIDFGKEEVFTMAEVEATIRGLKSEQATGKDKIRPQMLRR